MYFDTSKLPFTEHYTVSASSSKTGIKLFPLVSSLLRSRFFRMSHNAPPKKWLLTTEPHSFIFVFVVCLHSVEQANHIITKCEWRTCKISRKRPLVRDFWPLFHAACMPPKNGPCSQAMIMTEEKKCEWKPHCKCKCFTECFMCSLLCSANERVIFWDCLISSVNQGLKASYRLKTGEKSGTQNSLSTNQVKPLDFVVPLWSKLK